MEKIKSIQLGFENVEVVNIDAEDIESVLLQGIENELYVSYWDSCLKESERAKKAIIVLKNTADKPLEEPVNAETVFARIQKFNDLTDILIRGEDGTERRVVFGWDEKSEYVNPFQTSKIDYKGSLIIVICRTENAENVCKRMTPQIVKFMGRDAT